MSITRAVIPAAGLGTRMLPAAKAVPKELLPIVDRPTIQYVLEEVAAAGIAEAVLVTSAHKPSLLRHFRHDAGLERQLRAVGRQELLASIDRLIARVKISSVDQPKQRGLGDAVLQARSLAGDGPFLCLLGDAVFSGDVLPASQLVAAYRQLGTALIGLEKVPPEKVARYGIVGGKFVGDGVVKIDTLVEKPCADAAPSNLAVAARYVLTPAIFECLDTTGPGKGGEIQLTDALKILLEREPIHGVVLSARRHDIGDPVDWLKTNLLFAARDPALWKQLRPLLDALPRD